MESKKIVVNAKEFLKTLKRTVIATEDAKRTVLKGAHVLVGQDFLIIVGRKSPYFSEGLDSPSLRQ